MIAAGEPLLSIRGLTLSAPGGARPVNAVEFDCAPGRTTAVVGESGSGKTLTALALMGLLPAGIRVAAGAAEWRRPNPCDLLSLSPREHQRLRGRRLAMIFQEFMSSLNPVMTLGEQLGEALALHRGLRGRALRIAMLEALETVGIDDPPRRLRGYPHQLSGGMRQRALIAIALAGDPDLLIADEPTSALDAPLREGVLALIASLRRDRGLAVILISHDLPLVARHADDAVVMYAGRVVERGPVASVMKSPAHPYTRGLIACLPGTATRGRHLPTVADFLVPSPGDRPGHQPWWPGRGAWAGLRNVGPGHAAAVCADTPTPAHTLP